ncbi:MAG: hypothetical protein RLN77_06010, partial [Rhodospirillales bacterium]
MFMPPVPRRRSGPGIRPLIAALALLTAALTLDAGAALAKVFSPETFTLDNGMQVVFVSNHRAPVVT